VADVGAGVGQLKRFLQAHPNNVTDYQGFDAAYNIQEFWGMPAPLGGNENYLVPHKVVLGSGSLAGISVVQLISQAGISVVGII
jgi:hypothetical protein